MNFILNETEKYVQSFLKDNLSEKLLFHNINHTYEVVEAVKEIRMTCNLSSEEMTIVEIAAWFHDCGYAHAYLGHEEESKKIAKAFLESLKWDSANIASVLKCIDATKFPQYPNSLIDKILCDADMYHFTRASYLKYEKALRFEFEVFLGLTFTNKQWDNENICVMDGHIYKTEYGKQVLTKFKDINLQLLINKQV